MWYKKEINNGKFNKWWCIKPISDLGIVLLDKIEKATGWIFSTTTAKKEGYKNIIEEISKRDDINPIKRT